ncbi:hypothetical protein D1872_163490 [compost metagenome]
MTSRYTMYQQKLHRVFLPVMIAPVPRMCFESLMSLVGPKAEAPGSLKVNSKLLD